MKETTVYFIRHGETDFNRKGIVQGRRINSSLNETGRAQAFALARRFSEVQVDAFYSSNLTRAIETVNIIAAEHKGIPVYRLSDLDEISWGIYEGEPVSSDVLKVFDEMNERWRQGDFHHAVEGGESVFEVQKRAIRAKDHIVNQHPGGTVVVVTHGRFLRILLATLLQSYGLTKMHEIQHANTAVNIVACRGDVYEAKLLNCTAHLNRAETFMNE